MAWSRIDDGFPMNPKIRAIGDRAFRLYVLSIPFSNGGKTAGFLSKDDVKMLGILAKMSDKNLALATQELVENGLFHDESEHEKGAFSIHDWAVYNGNPSGSTERMQRLRERHKTEANVTRHNTVTNPSRRDASPSRTRVPVPSQKEINTTSQLGIGAGVVDQSNLDRGLPPGTPPCGKPIDPRTGSTLSPEEIERINR